MAWISYVSNVISIVFVAQYFIHPEYTQCRRFIYLLLITNIIAIIVIRKYIWDTVYVIYIFCIYDNLRKQLFNQYLYILLIYHMLSILKVLL